ncbi:MAG: single-stranded DNA-binding protein [Patescibacteria group bacterium]|nr:single-stranded DNA-binding protein [Patescibacteria group bacterium]
MDLNKVSLIGRLTRDPETRTTPQNVNVVSFGLATNLIWTDQSGNRQEKVEYHNLVAWRKLADICSQYLHKGDRIYLEGRLETRSWEDQNGAKHSRTEIVAQNMIMLDTKGGNNSNRPSAPVDSTPREEEINVEEIPF